MATPGKVPALAIMIGRAGKPGMAPSKEPEGDEGTQDYSDVGAALLSAIHSGDPSAVGQALKSAVSVCSGE